MDPSVIYYGKRINMLVEVLAWDPLTIGIKPALCRYLVMPLGDAKFETE